MRKLKFEDHRNCLEDQLEENEIDKDSLTENHKEIIKSNILILKSQQIFRSEKISLFTKEVNKITMAASDD